MDKLEILNSIEVVDCSVCGGECEYVLADITAENIVKLVDAGFTADQIVESMGDDKDYIDLSLLAFSYADAWWWRSGGKCDRCKTEVEQRGFFKEYRLPRATKVHISPSIHNIGDSDYWLCENCVAMLRKVLDSCEV